MEGCTKGTRVFVSLLMAVVLVLGTYPALAIAEEVQMTSEVETQVEVLAPSNGDTSSNASADDPNLTTNTNNNTAAEEDVVAATEDTEAEAWSNDAASAVASASNGNDGAEQDEAPASEDTDLDLATQAASTTNASAAEGDADVDVDLSTQSMNRASAGYYAAVNAFISDYRWCDGAAWGWQKPYISSYSSWQCYAYACDFTKYMYGVDHYRDGTYFSSASQVRTGDVIRASGHTFVVLERVGNYLWTAEGNFEETVRVERYGYRIEGNGFERMYNGNDITWISFTEGFHFNTGVSTDLRTEGETTSIANARVYLSTTGVTYNGKARKPAVKSVVVDGRKLVEGADYTVAYRNNTNAGVASVIITGKGLYAGTRKATFEIWPKKLSSVSVGKILERVYNGQLRKPIPIVCDGSKRLYANTDFTMSYRNNRAAGNATAILTGTGNYTGVVKVTFKIKRAQNPITARVRMQSVAFPYDAKRVRRVSNIVASGGQGKVTYIKLSGSKYLSVNKDTGQVTLARATKPGVYRIKVKVRAGGDKNYLAGATAVTFTVIVRG